MIYDPLQSILSRLIQVLIVAQLLVRLVDLVCVFPLSVGASNLERWLIIDTTCILLVHLIIGSLSPSGNCLLNVLWELLL